jgi:hypothetical protein
MAYECVWSGDKLHDGEQARREQGLNDGYVALLRVLRERVRVCGECERALRCAANNTSRELWGP